jgi:transposase
MGNITVGMDISDKKHQICMLNPKGKIIDTCQIDNTREAITNFFSRCDKTTVAIEAGTHSPWISRLLESLGMNVLVGNPRKLRAIWDSDDKDDIRDAEMLARIARFDRNLLYPIEHREEKTQADLAVIKARDILVQSRSKLINHIRGAVKPLGGRIPSCDAKVFYKRALEHIPDSLRPALEPIIDHIDGLTQKIKEYNRYIEKLSSEKYPETSTLRQITGVGPLTALAFILTIENHKRFVKSRDVGPFLGLTPKRDQSGEVDKQLRITKAGNSYLRKLLVGSSHYILGPFGPDCNLRRFGMKKMGKGGGKIAKRRAVIAVARKLAVLMHRLWRTGEVYEPVFNTKKLLKKAA